MNNINKVTFILLVILCSIPLYFSISKKAYFFGKWVPQEFLEDIGIPIKTIKILTNNFDLVVHLIISYIATILLLYSLTTIQKTNLIFSLITISLTTSIFIFIECYQASIGRGFSFADILAGILGSILSVITYKLIRT